ncbi:hypothetical protein INT46_007132 [Mucor plumbeus]|uniref:F-box domain-containing protein n=1 Tax=Mucor plumbeus TaxID=97098 RepID=A0A8H7UUV1_9FUNG|nr:hypothetical protein INT46_007132 [Mucor plumbeus]
MTLLTPSLITPTTSKLLSYLSFNSSTNNKPHAQSSSSKSSDIPTYITIVMRKDGTPTTKCLNPNNTNQQPQLSRPSLLLTRRRRSSFSSSQCLSSPPKQRRLMISSFIPRFNVSPRRTSSNNSISSYNSINNTLVGEQTTIVTADYLIASQPRFLNLPSELNMKILMLLDYKSLLNLAQSCKQLFQLCHRNHHYLWQTLFHADHAMKITKPVILPYYDLYKNHHELSRRWKKGHVNTRYLTGHDDSVYCLVWVGPNLIVSGSRDRSIKLWNLSKQKDALILTKTHHDGSVLCLRASSDMTWMVSGSSDSTCLIWSLPDFEPKNRLIGHAGGVLDICIVDDMIVSSSRDSTIRVWDKNQGTEIRRLVGHAGPVNALGSYGGLVVSASGDTTLKLWDIATGNCLKTFVGHTRGLACVRFDGDLIYSGGQDNKLKVWDVQSGKCISTLTGHSDLIRTIDSFQASPNISILWDIKENKCLLSFQSGHSSWIFNCLSNRTKIISAGQDKRIMVLDFGHNLVTMDS